MMTRKNTNGNEPFIRNSFQTPNFYVDELMPLLTPTEWKVLSYSVRRIFGFQKRADRISLSQYISGIVTQEGKRLDSGTGLSRSAVITALKGLTQYGVLQEVSPNDSHFNNGTEYSLPIDGSTIDFVGLELRARGRTKAASQKLKPANQARSIARTAPSSSREPHPVHGMDTQHTEENQKKNSSAGDTTTSGVNFFPGKDLAKNSVPEYSDFSDLSPGAKALLEQAIASDPKHSCAYEPGEAERVAAFERIYGMDFIREVIDEKLGIDKAGRGLICTVINGLPFATAGWKRLD